MTVIAVIGTGKVGAGFAQAAVAALDAIETKYHQHGKRVEIAGLNDASQAFHSRLAGSVAAGHSVVLANSRGPESLSEIVAALGERASADTVVGAADRAEMLLLAVPLHRYDQLPSAALDGRIVMDAGNYYTDWSGRIEALDDESTTTSELLQASVPAARVVKAFNSIYAEEIATDARPGGGPRRALPVAGDDAAAKDIVSELIQSIGFDVVDAGPLREGWRFQRGTPAYVVPLTATELVRALADARRYRDMEADDVVSRRTHLMPEAERETDI